jgi:hypothetical protein
MEELLDRIKSLLPEDYDWWRAIVEQDSGDFYFPDDFLFRVLPSALTKAATGQRLDMDEAEALNLFFESPQSIPGLSTAIPVYEDMELLTRNTPYTVGGGVEIGDFDFDDLHVRFLNAPLPTRVAEAAGEVGLQTDPATADPVEPTLMAKRQEALDQIIAFLNDGEKDAIDEWAIDMLGLTDLDATGESASEAQLRQAQDKAIEELSKEGSEMRNLAMERLFMRDSADLRLTQGLKFMTAEDGWSAETKKGMAGVHEQLAALPDGRAELEKYGITNLDDPAQQFKFMAMMENERAAWAGAEDQPGYRHSPAALFDRLLVQEFSFWHGTVNGEPVTISKDGMLQAEAGFRDNQRMAMAAAEEAQALGLDWAPAVAAVKAATRNGLDVEGDPGEYARQLVHEYAAKMDQYASEPHAILAMRYGDQFVRDIRNGEVPSGWNKGEVAVLLTNAYGQIQSWDGGNEVVANRLAGIAARATSQAQAESQGQFDPGAWELAATDAFQRRFLRAPSPVELDALRKLPELMLVSEVASLDLATNAPTDSGVSTDLAAALERHMRGRSQYKLMYDAKPASMTDSEYAAAMARAGAGMLGFTPDDKLLSAGMRSGNPLAIYQQAVLSPDQLSKSTSLRSRVARMADVLKQK